MRFVALCVSEAAQGLTSGVLRSPSFVDQAIAEFGDMVLDFPACVIGGSRASQAQAMKPADRLVVVIHAPEPGARSLATALT